MNRNEIQAILDDIKFRNWTFYLSPEPSVPYLQVQFLATDTSNPYPSINPQGLRIPKGQPQYEPKKQGGRKWLLSEHMVRSEIVQTAWLAIKTAIEHEAREEFLYRGQAIFGPHQNVEYMGGTPLEAREHAN